MSNAITVTSYIQGHDAATLKSHQSRSAEEQADYLIPHIKPDSQILDVGCGPGTITCGFAVRAPSGKTIGIDYSEEVIQKARDEAKKRGIENVIFQAASAFELPFSDDTFDIVHCHAVLIHLPNAVNALKEMHRVCKPGGYVAAREPDWSTCVIHPFDPRLEQWRDVHAELKRREGAEPNAGRHLAEWAVTVGFHPSKIQLTTNTLQYFGKEGVKWWGELYAARMNTEFGKRAVEAGLATADEVEQFKAAYLDWSKKDTGLWVMLHMKLLCQK